jgi:pimeloyl-ACP methyl ester carboxylesterase
LETGPRPPGKTGGPVPGPAESAPDGNDIEGGDMPYAAVNGLHMYYEVHGEGPPLLSLHGGLGWIDPDLMRIGDFASRFRVIAIEQMGHGRTGDSMDRPFHYHDMAEDTVELMRQLGIESAVVVGFSDGGIIGLDMAIHHPERVSKLVVTGSNTRIDGYAAENQAWVRTLRPEDEPVSEAYRRLSPDGPGHWPAVVGRNRAMWIAEPAFTRDEVASIKAPTLIVIGDADIVTPEHAVEMFRTIPGARLCVVPNAGHGVMPMGTILAFLGAAPAGEK